MTDYIIHGQTLTDIADAIRSKNPDVTGQIDPSDMAQDILDISGGSGEPYIPREELVSNFDFASSTPYYDTIRDMQFVAPNYFSHTLGEGVEITDSSSSTSDCYFGTRFCLSQGGYYKIELELGDYTVSSSTSHQRPTVLNMCPAPSFTNECGSVVWRRDNQCWAIYNGSSWQEASSSYGENYFKNKKMIVLHNCKYDSTTSKIIKYTNLSYNNHRMMNLYDENWNLLIGDYQGESTNVNDEYQVGLGASDQLACVGMVYKSLKIYRLNLDVNPSQSIIQPLNITANGTYQADGVTVAGYSPVNVQIAEVLESEFDLLHCNSADGFTDLVQKYNLASNKYSNFANGYITGRGCKVLCSYLNQGDIKRIVVKTGEFDRTQETSDQTQRLFKFLLGNNHFNIQWDNTREGWTISDASGSPTFIDGSDLPKYSFDNTTIEMVFGAKYINGELYCGTKSGEVITNSFRSRLYVYINGNLVIEAPNEVITGDVNNTIGTIQVGGSYAWVGAKIENLKVYNVLNCYEKYYEQV